MRIPRVRFTVRRLMVAVAVVALLSRVGVEGERRRHRFQRLELDHLILSVHAEVALQGGPAREFYQPISDRDLKARVGYHRRMVAKYAWAARNSWLPVGPDPPPPK
jgi:hypothetical protein